MASKTIDALCILQDAVAKTATAVGQVGGSAKVFYAGDGYVGDHTEAIIDVTNMKTSVGDEAYTVSIEGSNSPTFASGVVQLAARKLTGTGRHELPFTNVHPDGTNLKYLRANFTIAGTAPTVTALVYLGKA